MKCERCGKTLAIHYDDFETFYRCIHCGYRSPRTKPEPEQDERISGVDEINMAIHKLRRVAEDSRHPYSQDVLNAQSDLQFLANKYLLENYKSGKASRNAEIESMRCCGNCGDTQKCSLNNGHGVCTSWKRRSE